jgi:hypothetical protein
MKWFNLSLYRNSKHQLVNLNGEKANLPQSFRWTALYMKYRKRIDYFSSNVTRQLASHAHRVIAATSDEYFVHCLVVHMQQHKPPSEPCNASSLAVVCHRLVGVVGRLDGRTQYRQVLEHHRAPDTRWTKISMHIFSQRSIKRHFEYAFRNRTLKIV